MALIWKFYNAVCTATSTFDKWHDIRCLRAEFTAKHGKDPLSLTTRWWMDPDLGSWQSPDISRSHLYRGTIAWTPPTAIYRAYTVFLIGHVTLVTIDEYYFEDWAPMNFIYRHPIFIWGTKKKTWQSGRPIPTDIPYCLHLVVAGSSFT